MKEIEKRIRHLEDLYQTKPRDGFLMEELLFILSFYKRWPDLDSAPKFALAEFHRINNCTRRSKATL